MSKRSVYKRTGTLIAAAAVIAATFGGGFALAATSSQTQQGPPTQPSQFVGIQPVRLLDTRVPIGVPTKAKLGPGQSINVAIAGQDGIPSNATAAAINVTVDHDATALSYLTVYPTGQARPTTSTLNVNPGFAMASGGSFALGTGGDLTVYNAAGSVNVIIDVTGYFVCSTPTK
jgi:hypothetical protein